MKRIINHITTLFILAMAFAGCSKDLGNYDYRPINDVYISTIADTFRVLIQDTLKITPVITAQDVSRLRYEWRVNPVEDPNEPLGMGKIEVISRDRNINAQITLKTRATPYELNFVAIDTITGVSYFKNLRLDVRTAFQTGWMLLEQKSSQADISFIGFDDKVYTEVYSSANPEKPLPVNAKKLISANTQSLAGVINMVCLDNGGVVLDNVSMVNYADYTKLFFAPPATPVPQNVIKPNLISYGPYTFAGGKLHQMNAIFTGTLFGAAFTQPDNKGYSLAPYAAADMSFGGIFFDQLNHRFLYDGGGTSTALKAFPATPTHAFDLSNVQKNMLCMKAGMGWDLWPDNWYALFKNKTDDNCFLYTVKASGNLSNDPVANSAQQILNSPDVHRSPDYLFSNTVKQMYYAADNKLYVYDMLANQSRVVYTFAAGENITTMQIYMNNTIVLATYNGSADGGTVYFLPVSSTGDITGNTYSKRFTGFNKIVHLVYKVG